MGEFQKFKSSAKGILHLCVLVMERSAKNSAYCFDDWKLSGIASLREYYLYGRIAAKGNYFLSLQRQASEMS